uniref:Uncharacterized protein n=1 Tax=Knipowitschia caucasica TaxID=637954 RepID=A0AAV2LZS7_KNICA
MSVCSEAFDLDAKLAPHHEGAFKIMSPRGVQKSPNESIMQPPSPLEDWCGRSRNSFRKHGLKSTLQELTSDSATTG